MSRMNGKKTHTHTHTHTHTLHYSVHCFWLVLVVVCTTVFLCVKVFFWCPCTAINVSVQYNVGLLPDIILSTQCYYHWGTHLNAMKKILSLQPMIPPNKRFDIFPPMWDAQKVGLDAFRFFFKHKSYFLVRNKLTTSALLAGVQVTY